MATNHQPKHFVAVHGSCQGAWIYYKLKTLIEIAGHRFTSVDLAASGINEKKLNEVRTLHDYTLPLLDVLASIPEGEKVILLGHSGGGMSAALGMEKFPEKISVGVFLAAIMPDTTHGPSYFLEEDLTLAKTFVRPGSIYLEDLSTAPKFSKERYGSVKRVYIVCKDDLAIPEEFQRWMIEIVGATEVKEIKGADHMAMLSKPKELSHCLLEIAKKYD
ncbi:unnamed protein product [Ilex paraguariensis]|uniref:AB hydrolase-1 domain-containing protein n=1 Tax=Ilex paraguariensis TaxID=185542 RepID=A0ABC8SYE3_9AQUA